jgi:hypothetical protein
VISKSISLRATIGMGLLVATACGSDPDVVADKSAPEDPGFEVQPSRSSCSVGTYEGRFLGKLGSPEAGVDFRGDIRFTLEATLQREFPVVKNSQLEGQGDDSGLPIPFEADVSGDDDADCRDGYFEARLVGTYRIGDAAYPFEGPISGNYDGDYNGFLGDWQALSVPEGTYLAGGIWMAALIEP